MKLSTLVSQAHRVQGEMWDGGWDGRYFRDKELVPVLTESNGEPLQSFERGSDSQIAIFPPVGPNLIQGPG